MDAAIRRSALTASRIVPSRSLSVLSIFNAAALVAVLVVVSSVRLDTSTTRVGQVAGATVVAARTVTYPDAVLTAAARQKAAAEEPAIYKTDTATATERRQQAATFLSAASAVISSSQPVPQKAEALRHLLPIDVSSNSLHQTASLGPQEFRSAARRSLALLAQAAAWRFDTSQVTSYEAALLSTIPPRVAARERTAVGEILTIFLYPTRVLDLTATRARQKEAAAAIPIVTSTVYSGEVVVRRGDIVTRSTMEKLTALGLQSRRTGWQDVAGSLLFAAAIVVTLFWYLYAFHPSIVSNPRLLLLIDAGVLGSVVGARLLATDHILLPFFLPLAAIPTFAAALIAPEACIALALAMAVLAGWVVANSFEITMYYFLTGAAGVLAIRKVRQLKEFVFAGGYIMAFGLATLLAFALVDRVIDLSAMQGYVAAAVFNGFVSSTVALGAFALLSSFFGVTTSLQLLELGQPSQLLLRRLMARAPGTYNHSLILASMVEHAAEEIGANSLAAKLGALYHDIGKSVNPHCFVENQLGMANIHDELRAEESARIIRGHVSAGLRMARQHRLPRVVLDAIAEHHGTMTIAYFLHKARREGGGDAIDTALYTYPGPKPQSKETALLMLADGSESAVRAQPDHSGSGIRETVHKIVQERIESGQLDESPLTLRDLDRAENAFCAVLNGLYHPRIEYPEPGEPVLDIDTTPQIIPQTGVR